MGLAESLAGAKLQGIRNIHVHDCLFDNVRHAVYFKTRRPRGGGGENFLAERITFSAYNHAIFFDMLGATMYVGELANRLPVRPITELTPYYRNITLRRFQGECKGDALKVKGIPESPASDITLEQCDIRSNGLIHLADVEDVEIQDSKFYPAKPEILLLDANGVHFKQVHFESARSRLVVKASGNMTKQVTFEQCEPAFGRMEIETSDGTEGDVLQELR